MPLPEYIPEYAEVNHAFNALDAEVDAPEGHGILCGMLSAGIRVNDEIWLSQVLPASGEISDSEDMLKALYQFTVFQLDDPDFSFQPLLPDEAEPLDARTRALSHWCSGFLYGLGLSGMSETAGLPNDAAEVLVDLVKIASVDYQLQEAGESEERAYAEVVEYVRVGTLLIFESLRGPREDEHVH